LQSLTDQAQTANVVVDRPLRRTMLFNLRLRRLTFGIELTDGRVRPFGGQGTARPT